MRQSRKASFAEACLNTFIGYWINIGAQCVIFPLFGVHIGIAANLSIGLAFTVISIVRGYTLRRAFEALRMKGILP